MPTGSPTRGDVPDRERIARILREAIDAGTYPPGVLLPGEKALAADFSVSPHSVRESLAILGAEGRVHAVNGKGTVVLSPPVPHHLIEFDPADPWHGLTAVTEPTPTRGAADRRTAKTLGIADREPLFIVEQSAVHTTGALVRVRRILPHCAYDGMTTYPDPVGPRESIIKALNDAHGPLNHHVRYGAAMPTTDDRVTLKITTLGSVILYAAAITRADNGQGLLLDTVHYAAAEAEVTTRASNWPLDRQQLVQ
jgi:hypothetical protein